MHGYGVEGFPPKQSWPDACSSQQYKHRKEQQEVRGDGVRGEQPRIKPGEVYKYTSGTILGTPMGTMGGSYQMVTDEGEEFNASIPEFLLSIPRTLH